MVVAICYLLGLVVFEVVDAGAAIGGVVMVPLGLCFVAAGLLLSVLPRP